VTSVAPLLLDMSATVTEGIPEYGNNVLVRSGAMVGSALIDILLLSRKSPICAEAIRETKQWFDKFEWSKQVRFLDCRNLYLISPMSTKLLMEWSNLTAVEHLTIRPKDTKSLTPQGT
jgi:hypothetical protein